jgi:hypothetical protein
MLYSPDTERGNGTRGERVALSCESERAPQSDRGNRPGERGAACVLLRRSGLRVGLELSVSVRRRGGRGSRTLVSTECRARCEGRFGVRRGGVCTSARSMLVRVGATMSICGGELDKGGVTLPSVPNSSASAAACTLCWLVSRKSSGHLALPR